MTSSWEGALYAIFSGVGGLVLGYICRHWNDRRRIRYSADGVVAIEKRHPIDGLSITHEGVPVDRLTLSRVWLWNGSMRSIKPEHVVSGNPLTIGTTDGGTVLSVRVAYESPDAVGFTASPFNSERWRINFEHWEGKSGVVLEVLHTSSKIVLDVRGTVDGLKPIERLGRIASGSFLSKRRRKFERVAPLLGLVLMGFGVWGIAALDIVIEPKMILGFMLLLPGEFLLLSSGVEFIERLRIPRSIRTFYGEASIVERGNCQGDVVDRMAEQ